MRVVDHVYGIWYRVMIDLSLTIEQNTDCSVDCLGVYGRKRVDF